MIDAKNDAPAAIRNPSCLHRYRPKTGSFANAAVKQRMAASRSVMGPTTKEEDGFVVFPPDASADEAMGVPGWCSKIGLKEMRCAIVPAHPEFWFGFLWFLPRIRMRSRSSRILVWRFAILCAFTDCTFFLLILIVKLSKQYNFRSFLKIKHY